MTDKQLVRFVAAFRSGMLGRRSSRGCCGMVCLPLSTYLALHGVENEIIEVDLMDEPSHRAANHCWLRLPDGRALDPTADQFNTDARRFPRVYLGEPVLGIHVARTEGR